MYPQIKPGEPTDLVPSPLARSVFCPSAFVRLAKHQPPVTRHKPAATCVKANARYLRSHRNAECADAAIASDGRRGDDGQHYQWKYYLSQLPEHENLLQMQDRVLLLYPSICAGVEPTSFALPGSPVSPEGLQTANPRTPAEVKTNGGSETGSAVVLHLLTCAQIRSREA